MSDYRSEFGEWMREMERVQRRKQRRRFEVEPHVADRITLGLSLSCMAVSALLIVTRVL